MGNIVYQPKGKAREYAPWAANIFVGCSNDCEYCYCKKGVLGHGMGQKLPQLKKEFQITPKSASAVDRQIAFIIGCNKAVQTFEKELNRYRQRIMEAGRGVFFTFSSDPCLREPVDTFGTFSRCAYICLGCNEDGSRTNDLQPVPVTMLTKRSEWVYGIGGHRLLVNGDKNLCVGFTLTGRDDLEPNASTNQQRVEAMAKVKEYGVHTFASIEPVIDLDESLDMVKATLGFCDVYKIGLESGHKHNKKPITLDGIVKFVDDVQKVVAEKSPKARIYWKDSITSKVNGLIRYSSQVVNASHNIFAGK